MLSASSSSTYFNRSRNLALRKSHWWSHSDVFLAYSLSELEGYAHFASTIDAEGSKIDNLGTARTNEQLVNQHKTIRQIPLDRWEPASA
jgi:hypothetical protein